MENINKDDDFLHLPEEINQSYINKLVFMFIAHKTLSSVHVHEILTRSRLQFESLPNLIEIQVPKDKQVTVVGDTHGQFWDLLEIFEKQQRPSNDNIYVFNGDFVDRGSFGCEVFLTLVCMKLAYPNTIHILRGNHECRQISSQYGFRRECEAKYDLDVYYHFLYVFNALPLCALINKEIFVVHGGIPSAGNILLRDISDLNRFGEPGEGSEEVYTVGAARDRDRDDDSIWCSLNVDRLTVPVSVPLGVPVLIDRDNEGERKGEEEDDDDGVYAFGEEEKQNQFSLLDYNNGSTDNDIDEGVLVGEEDGNDGGEEEEDFQKEGDEERSFVLIAAKTAKNHARNINEAAGTMSESLISPNVGASTDKGIDTGLGMVGIAVGKTQTQMQAETQTKDKAETETKKGGDGDGDGETEKGKEKKMKRKKKKRKEGGNLDAATAMAAYAPTSSSIITEMLWADPCEEKGIKNSIRGMGYSFGPDVTECFLRLNKIKKVIRSHEVCPNGYKYHHSDKLITLFSCPRYGGSINLGACLRIGYGLGPALESGQDHHPISSSLVNPTAVLPHPFSSTPPPALDASHAYSPPPSPSQSPANSLFHSPSHKKALPKPAFSRLVKGKDGETNSTNGNAEGHSDRDELHLEFYTYHGTSVPPELPGSEGEVSSGCVVM